MIAALVHLLAALWWLVLLLLAFATGSVALWPYARCAGCNGTGRTWGSSSRRWGMCRRCAGTGRRLRWAAR
ncbi:MAG TPA: hypothetical protein VIX86_06870, partial [Streptosporangiaceae bacterium]